MSNTIVSIRLYPLCVFLLVLQGCSSGGDDTPSSATTGTELDVEITGSVGDGPVVNANLTVYSKTGEILSRAISSQTAGYNIQLKTKGKYYPLTIEALGGDDLVTHTPPGFAMISAATEPRRKAVANINPFTTLAIFTARQMRGGLTTTNLSTAMSTVVGEFNLGLTSQLSLDPMTTPIDDTNLAEIVKASETLAEIFRRAHASLASAPVSYSIDGVIDAIAADLVDGALDGAGAPSVDRRVTAVTIVAAAQVVLEAMTNELKVNGQVVTATLDNVIGQLASKKSAPLTASRPVTAYMIDQALHGIDAAIAVSDSAELQTLRAALVTLVPGSTPSAASKVLPADSGSALDSQIALVGSGTDAEIDAAITGQAALPPPAPTPAPNSPPSIWGTPATSVMQDSAYSFVPSASDPDGDPLTFAIAGLPSWASFDPVTGELSGTPTAADVGAYGGIDISVTDGIATVGLAPFSIDVQAASLGSATLSWVAPTQNDDGTPLSDLAGYRFRWGTQSGSYTSSVTVMNPGITTYVVDNLTTGTYYFVVTALNANLVESTFSNEVSKKIP